ncbi:MAG: replication protein [Acidobacteriota bacterium]|nr:replication protein [Acidobacteriota bacterium]
MARALVPNSTQIPDVILDLWMAELSGAELKVVLYIARRTYGFGKESDNISLNQIAGGIKKRDGTVLDRGTGLSVSSVARAVKSLEEQKFLIRKTNLNDKNEHDENTYSLNLNWPEVLPNSENPLSKSEEGYSQNRSTGTPKFGGGVLPKSETQETVQETVQETAAAANNVAAVISESFKLLRDRGFDDAAARELSSSYPEERIKRQCEWIQLRVTDRNKLGALRKSIVEDWSDPRKGKGSENHEGELARQESAKRRRAIDECPLCDNTGYRYVWSEKYPRGAAKKCTHDPAFESNYVSYEAPPALREEHIQRRS